MKRNEKRILLLGLDGAGKTTYVNTSPGPKLELHHVDVAQIFI
jgi:GTPase SAR1 family protein